MSRPLTKEELEDFSLEDINDYLTEIFMERLPRRDRKIIMTRVCKTFGTIVEDSTKLDLILCDDPDCGSCKLVRKSIQKAIDEI